MKGTVLILANCMCLCILPMSLGKGEGASVKDEGGEVGAAKDVPGGEDETGTREGPG